MAEQVKARVLTVGDEAAIIKMGRFGKVPLVIADLPAADRHRLVVGADLLVDVQVIVTNPVFVGIEQPVQVEEAAGAGAEVLITDAPEAIVTPPEAAAEPQVILLEAYAAPAKPVRQVGVIKKWYGSYGFVHENWQAPSGLFLHASDLDIPDGMMVEKTALVEYEIGLSQMPDRIGQKIAVNARIITLAEICGDELQGQPRLEGVIKEGPYQNGYFRGVIYVESEDGEDDREVVLYHNDISIGSSLWMMVYACQHMVGQKITFNTCFFDGEWCAVLPVVEIDYVVTITTADKGFFKDATIQVPAALVQVSVMSGDKVVRTIFPKPARIVNYNQLNAPQYSLVRDVIRLKLERWIKIKSMLAVRQQKRDLAEAKAAFEKLVAESRTELVELISLNGWVLGADDVVSWDGYQLMKVDFRAEDYTLDAILKQLEAKAEQVLEQLDDIAA